MHAYTKLVKKFLNGYMAETREQRGMSKEEMSERLRIEPRSYADLEKERYCLSAPSLDVYKRQARVTPQNRYFPRG